MVFLFPMIHTITIKAPKFLSTADDTLENEIKVIANVFRTEQQYQVCGMNALS